MPTLADKRFVVVTGKGGVGKTTVSAVEALVLAGSGKRVLIAMCNAKERLSTLFGAAPIGHDIAAVADGIWATNIQPDRAMHEYGDIVFHSRALSKAVLDNPYVRGFLKAIPGMHEWAMLGKAWWHTTERRSDGSPKYDVVILDAPATGHGLDMLRVPSVILEAMPPGLLRRDAERAWKLISDPKLCAIVVVCLSEEMPVSETIDLTKSIGQLGLSVTKVIVNAMIPRLFSDPEQTALAALRLQQGGGPGERALECARARAARERLQAECLARLSHALPAVPSLLPMLFEEVDNPGAVRKLMGWASHGGAEAGGMPEVGPRIRVGV